MSTNCIGCGIVKQHDDPNQAGYVVKLENQYCVRCFRINHYNNLVPQPIDQSGFLTKLALALKQPKPVSIFYILDIFDLDGSRILKLEKLMRPHQVHILINKIDLLPKAVKLSKIRAYVQQMFKNTPLAHANIILCTSYKQNFIFSLINTIKKHKLPAYFVGSSNVGKSSLINAILKANKLVPKIVVSRFFNTTLDFIDISLDSHTKIIDTPGIARDNSIANLVEVKYSQYFYFTKEVKQITYQLQTNNSIFWGTVCWMDFTTTSHNAVFSVHLFTNRFIKTHRTNTHNAFNYYHKHRGTLLPTIVDNNIQMHIFEFDNEHLHKEYDILISGLGWINFKITAPCKIVVNIPSDAKKIMVFLRKNLI